MVWPLLAVGLGGLALSGGANLYSQWNSRNLYRRQINAYSNLQKGYSNYLAKHGRKLNPDRAYERWGSKIDAASTGISNSYAGSIGTLGGTVGAGSMLLNPPLTKRWL